MLSMHRGKGTVRFEWTDDVVQSSVTLLAEDDEPTIVSKLKRVIALAEGDHAPRPTIAGWTGEVQGPKVSGGDVLSGNGWVAASAMTPPVVPEGAEYELIPPGEDA